MNQQTIRKKIVSLFLVFLLLLSCAAPAFAAQPSAVLRENAKDLRYANGMMGGLFYPDDEITRFSVAEMLYYLLRFQNVVPDRSFTDIKDAFGEVPLATLAGAGILKGFPDQTIRPGDYLTRGEFAVVLCRVLHLEGSAAAAPFQDTAAHWAKQEIGLVTAKGLMKGFSDVSFRPDESVTRAQCVVTLNRMIGKADMPQKKSYFEDLSPAHWAYGAVMAAASGTNCNTYLSRPDVKFEDMEAKLPSLKDYEYQWEEKLWALLCAETFQKFGEAIADTNLLVEQVSLAQTLAQLHYDLNTADDASLKELYRLQDYATAAQKAIKKRNETMLQSSVRAAYESVYGSIAWMEEYNALYSDAMLELFRQEQDLAYQYQATRAAAMVTMDGVLRPLAEVTSLSYAGDLAVSSAALRGISDYYESNRYVYDNILSDLIDVRNKQAKLAGYDSYTQFYPKLNTAVTYSREDVKTLRGYLKESVAPLLGKLSREAADLQGVPLIRFGVDTPFISESYAPLYSTEETYEKVLEILENLSPQTSQYVQYMEAHNLLDILPSPSKASGAYSTYLPLYQVPFVYGLTADSRDLIDTFSHELGHGFHYFRSYNTTNPSASSDLAETHSYSTQLLISTQFAKLYENPDAAQKALLYTLLSLMADTAMLDEYQETLYDRPDLSQIDRNNLYASLVREYHGGIEDYSLYPSYGNGKVQDNDNHVFLHPFYAVDYALALTNAFQIFDLFEADFDEGFNTYMKLIDIPPETAYLDAVEAAGLRSPFDPATVKAIVERLESLLCQKP